MERTQVPSKIIYIISIMNTAGKKITPSLGYKLTHYIVTGGGGGEIHHGRLRGKQL